MAQDLRYPEWIGVPNDLSKYVGFVYVITNIKTGKRYFGKKTFWRSTSAPPCLNPKKKYRESDWRVYWGSSKNVKKDIDKLGTENFTRRIISCWKSKWRISYEELKIQMEHKVLEPNTLFYNEYIGCRLRKPKKLLD